MKKSFLLFALIATTLASFGQTRPTIKKPAANAKPVVSKFGALAIDRSNGFFYGWSYDYSTLVEAEQKAIEECNKKGGNCTIVLSYSGTGCAAYRTVDGNQGTAFGWGLAKTKEEADVIATKECLKRSNGTNPTNFVWSCNSEKSGILNEIYNAGSEIITTVKVGSQIWTNQNLNISTFRNGDKIPEVKTSQEWDAAFKEGRPVWIYLDAKPENGVLYGKLYNWYAVSDSRGLAPKGFRVPSIDDWDTLGKFLGDPKTAGGKLKSKSEWLKLNGTDEYGFNALPGGNCCPFNGLGGIANFWSSTPKNDKSIYYLPIYYHQQEFKIGGTAKYSGLYVRCIKE